MLRRVFVVLAAALPVAQFASAADKLVGGPFVVNAGPNSATVVWILDGAGGKPGLSAQKTTLSGLEPGSAHSHVVPGLADGKVSFRTAPVGPAKFPFVVYGDTRSRHDVHRRVVEAILKVPADFAIHTGDMVADGRVEEQWPVFFSIEKELLSRLAFFPALGNHEHNTPKFYEFFDRSQPYYSFDWGAAHFTMLFSDIDSLPGGGEAKRKFWEEQKRWLEQDLEKSQGASLRFVTIHHPPFSAVKSRQGDTNPTKELVPLYERYKVAAVFSGHDHNYQHHLKNGVHYVVSGGGGAPLYLVDAPLRGITVKAESVENFVQVTVDGRQVRMEARRPNGSLIEGFSF